jgi:glycosyltransferase involved in cell wall biosynthesis
MPTSDFGPQLDLVCLSHLRWNFVFQRPQHLLTRGAVQRRVFYVEEPILTEANAPSLKLASSGGVTVVTPVLPSRLGSGPERDAALRRLLDECLARHDVRRFVLWYYTPMALAFSRHLSPELVVYDCMDELSAFAGAPPAMRAFEAELFARADVVFTGGRSLYEAKRALHANVHAMPSSVDVAHFAQARQVSSEPHDQAALSRPRLGYFGVIDERMDLGLLAAVADARPDWQIVMVGPVVKIDPASLPRRANLHFLGAKQYAELPQYIAFWNVALMPFARNESTRFISPTKTPEYLAAGKPVVSTSIRDVVRPYGRRGLVRIADEPAAFVRACDEAMGEDPVVRMRMADAFLETTSWDRTWSRMCSLMTRGLERKHAQVASSRVRSIASATGSAIEGLFSERGARV